MSLPHKWPKHLIIIRHGKSLRNKLKEEAKAAGLKTNYSEGVRDQDTPLTAEGTAQAEATGKNILDRYISQALLTVHDTVSINISDIVMFVSPYLRTRQTAARICHSMGFTPKIVIEERLREIEFGILDGLTSEGVKVKYPEEVARKAKEGKYWYRAPGGESRPDVRLRCHSFLDTLTRDYTDKTVFVICHSVVVLALRSLLERWTEDEYIQVDKENDVLNCGITRYSRNDKTGRLILQEYNTIAYETGVANGQ